ncbi:hypothetical protein CYMTET_42337 [Cymbomonas tetramitiformis]|uniref:Uncharacterized protein n=1 Tax=Cymbomonas tetramitiformis TaxID=36881 RepID=A0AAE0C4C9_9CHLO|nr:hypothetical protein CYMTET_42337 [Cymbomonas tetramitiformis]
MQSVDSVATGIFSHPAGGKDPYHTPQSTTGHWVAEAPPTRPRKQHSERPYFDSAGDLRRKLDFDSL